MPRFSSTEPVGVLPAVPLTATEKRTGAQPVAGLADEATVIFELAAVSPVPAIDTACGLAGELSAMFRTAE